jgi:hypothetical protein
MRCAVLAVVCLVGVARAQNDPSISSDSMGVMTVALPNTGALMVQQGTASALSVATTQDVAMAISTLTVAATQNITMVMSTLTDMINQVRNSLANLILFARWHCPLSHSTSCACTSMRISIHTHVRASESTQINGSVLTGQGILGARADAIDTALGAATADRAANAAAVVALT